MGSCEAPAHRARARRRRTSKPAHAPHMSTSSRHSAQRLRTV